MIALDSLAFLLLFSYKHDLHDLVPDFDPIENLWAFWLVRS